jgi:hypothetical protein
MGTLAEWLLHEDQKELFGVLYATALNALFLALTALLLWPLGRAALALRLAKGYWVFWIVIQLSAVLLILFRRVFRIDLDTHFDAYVISALAVCSFLQAGWSAFAALTVRSFAADASAWVASGLYFAGFLSSYVAFAALSAFYEGSLYRLINLPLALVSFILFAAWPAAARALYGWFFGLF